MRELSEGDKDNLAAILDYCDRISSIVDRCGHRGTAQLSEVKE